MAESDGTAPDTARPLSRVRTPIRHRRERQVVLSGITWLPAEQVPGAILSPQAQRELQAKLRALDEWVARSRASASTYWIYR